MPAAALACKAVIAVALLAAGGAKLADLPGFAATVRLFAPRGWPARVVRAIAVTIAAGEIATGAASLSSPQARWLNLVVLAVGCGFVVVAVTGYIWHPGRSCRCFGALSGRSFSVSGICRAAVIAIGAALAVTPASHAQVQVGLAGRLGLLGGAALLTVAAWTAAAAVGAGDAGQAGSQLRWAP
jgi:hypothetical protein